MVLDSGTKFCYLLIHKSGAKLPGKRGREEPE
jgi:hypothetical protein